MRAFASVTVVVLALATACLPISNQADGAACTDDGDCESDRCHEGFCSGSKCDLNDPSTCDGGWKCVHSDPDPISGFFGASGSNICRPLCGNCPGNMHCADGGKDGETLCSSGKAPLELDIQLPNVVSGRPARIVAVAAPPSGQLVKCEWETGDGKPDETTAGPELTHVFDVQKLARAFQLRVRCTDDGGRIGSTRKTVEVGCQPSEGACDPSVCCAGQGFHCLASPSGNVCRTPIAPTITIVGPTVVPRLESAEFSVTTAGGEGTVQSVSWTSSNSSFDRSGTTVSYLFSDGGPATVRASVKTSLGQDIVQTHALTVCQTRFDECTAARPCCAPLACKVSGSTMRCQE